MRFILLILLAATGLAHASSGEAGLGGAGLGGAGLGSAGLLDALRQGGLVIFLRHAETGSAAPDQARAVPGDCDTQRNLSAAGQAQAVEIGAQFRALGIPVGAVLASPFCRTMETGVLAFGRAAPEWALTLPRDTGHADAHRAMGDALLRLLPASLPPGQNLVLVGHSYHLIAAGGPRLEPQGAAAIFRPGGMSVLATLGPADWAALAAPAHASLR